MDSELKKSVEPELRASTKIVLWKIEEAHPISPTDLVHALPYGESTVFEALETLTDAGLVSRSRARDDARRRLYTPADS